VHLEIGLTYNYSRKYRDLAPRETYI
jgi:hypothetical protein